MTMSAFVIISLNCSRKKAGQKGRTKVRPKKRRAMPSFFYSQTTLRKMP
jgi:hypothetical protein